MASRVPEKLLQRMVLSAQCYENFMWISNLKLSLLSLQGIMKACGEGYYKRGLVVGRYLFD